MNTHDHARSANNKTWTLITQNSNKFQVIRYPFVENSHPNPHQFVRWELITTKKTYTLYPKMCILLFSSIITSYKLHKSITAGDKARKLLYDHKKELRINKE